MLKILGILARKLKESIGENRSGCLELQKLLSDKDGDILLAYRNLRNLDVVVALLTNIG